MKPTFIFLAACAALMLTAAGCGHRGGGGSGARIVYSSDHSVLPVSTPGKYGGNLTYCAPGDPKTFNPWVATDQSSVDVTTPTTDSLNGQSAFTLKFEPRLADLPKISADGRTYTFTLKPGLLWSDGQPLTADDVIFTLDMLFDTRTQGIMREGLLVDVPQPDGTTKHVPFQYKKLDARTVQFTLPVPYAPAMSMLTGFPIAPKHALEAAYQSGQINSTWGVNTPAAQFVSCGPFVVSEYAPGQRIIYKPNPHFWKKDAQGRPLPYLGTFTYLIVQDFNTTTLKFHGGESDVQEVRVENYPNEKKHEDAEHYTLIDRGPEWGFNYLTFNENPNSKNPPALIRLFRDQRFRQAVSYAVNRDRICNDIFLGLAKPLYGPNTPADTLFTNPNIPQYAYNLDKAKALLAQIGLKDTDGDGILNLPGGGPNVSFNIITNVENEERKATATIIADDLKKIGLASTFTPINFNDMIRRTETPPYDWQAEVGGFVGTPEPHGGVNIWRSDGTDHAWWPKQKTPSTPWEAQLNQLMLQGDREMNPVKRKAIYGQLQEIIAEQQPFIFTVYREQFTDVRNHFGNIKPSTLYGLNGSVLWNLEEIYDTNATGDKPGS